MPFKWPTASPCACVGCRLSLLMEKPLKRNSCNLSVDFSIFQFLVGDTINWHDLSVASGFIYFSEKLFFFFPHFQLLVQLPAEKKHCSHYLVIHAWVAGLLESLPEGFRLSLSHRVQYESLYGLLFIFPCLSYVCRAPNVHLYSHTASTSFLQSSLSAIRCLGGDVRIMVCSSVEGEIWPSERSLLWEMKESIHHFQWNAAPVYASLIRLLYLMFSGVCVSPLIHLKCVLIVNDLNLPSTLTHFSAVFHYVSY